MLELRCFLLAAILVLVCSPCTGFVSLPAKASLRTALSADPRSSSANTNAAGQLDNVAAPYKPPPRSSREIAEQGRDFVKETVQTIRQTGLKAGATRSTEAAFAGLSAAYEVARDLLEGVREGVPPAEVLSTLSPKALRKLFERLGATYIKGALLHAVADDAEQHLQALSATPRCTLAFAV
jgi:hypothetical protein